MVDVDPLWRYAERGWPVALRGEVLLVGGDPVGLADRLAALVDLDAGHVRRWLFARCVQECLEMPWLRPVATALAPEIDV